MFSSKAFVFPKLWMRCMCSLTILSGCTGSTIPTQDIMIDQYQQQAITLPFPSSFVPQRTQDSYNSKLGTRPIQLYQESPQIANTNTQDDEQEIQNNIPHNMQDDIQPSLTITHIASTHLASNPSLV